MILRFEAYDESYLEFRRRIARPSITEFESLKNSVSTATSEEQAYSFLLTVLSAEQRIELLRLAQQRAKELNK